MSKRYFGKIGPVDKEYVTASQVNWAVHIDGERRNFSTLRAARAFCEAVAEGRESCGLHEKTKTTNLRGGTYYANHDPENSNRLA